MEPEYVNVGGTLFLTVIAGTVMIFVEENYESADSVYSFLLASITELGVDGTGSEVIMVGCTT